MPTIIPGRSSPVPLCATLLALAALVAGNIALIVGTRADDTTNTGTNSSSVLAQTPLFVSDAVPPVNVLVLGRDHKLYAPAYDDHSDVDDDGELDLYYKPGYAYLGYFDSQKCYSYSTSNSGVFTPVQTVENTDSSAPYTCPTGKSLWSGNFLNYMTTSRIDALREVFYGGHRSTDTAASTVLERAYIPNDAHAWGKEYYSVARDGYDISKYTPLTAPTNGNYILFANTSITSGSTTLPKFRVIDSSQSSGLRIWGWVSRESTQGTNALTTTSNGSVTITPKYDYTVRVQACVSGLLESNCAEYANGTYKPTGLLHKYGASGSMYFALMTGTYTNNLQGGVLRTAPELFSDELDSYGRFVNKTGGASDANDGTTYVKSGGIVQTLDKIQYVGTSLTTNTTAQCTTISTSAPAYAAQLSNGSCINWGNPLGEIFYETLRYLSGSATPTSSYAAGTYDSGTLGLSSVSKWIDPYSSSASTPLPTCAKPYVSLISDVNPNYDSDLPGNPWSSSSAQTLGTFSFESLGDLLWSKEFGASKSINIGQSGTATPSYYAPTAKTASSFGDIRGLPEEPARQGSYASSVVAYYGSQNAITSTGQKVQTFAIALSSTLPNVSIATGSGTVKFEPYGVDVTSGTVNQVTGFYVQQIANTDSSNQDSSVNGGRPYYIFRVVYDDAAQQADYDMDAVVLYTVAENSDGTVSVTTLTEYAVAGYTSHFGYVISGTGTTTDGVYLETSGGGTTQSRYSLDTPDGVLPGGCTSKTCAYLPGLYNNSAAIKNYASYHTRTFTPSSSTTVTTLENPLWYAAKYGVTDLTTWDSKTSGTPDNYFLVSNPSKLTTQLEAAFNAILQSSSAVTAAAVSSSSTDSTDGAYVYTTTFSTSGWTGDLTKALKTYTANADGTTTASTTKVWSAASGIPTSGRNVYFGLNGALAPFQWNSTTQTALAALNADYNGNLDGQGSQRVAFLRGESDSYRTRSSLLGDIVNSSPALTSGADFRASAADALEGTSTYSAYATTQSQMPPMVYVGANDGMLHAFRADTGAETFAFVPTKVIPNLSRLTDATYGTTTGPEHRYFVDGTPVVSDAYINGGWHKVLLGTLGAGGREVFALDVSNPNAPVLLWEYTSDSDGDLGYTVPRPAIVRLHTGQWAALVPNGYDSDSASSGEAALFVINLADGQLIKKLTVDGYKADTAATLDGLGNGLSGIQPVDANSDGIVDYVYAGDLMGNLWRFDLAKTGGTSPLTAAASADDLAVSFGGYPLYVARTSAGTRQAITAPPVYVPHPSGTGALVEFGTGRYLTTSDKTATTTQSVYGIWDRRTAGEATTSSEAASATRSDLVQQAFTAIVYNGSTAFTLTSNAVTWTSADGTVAAWGWYADLPRAGERMVYDMTVYGSSLIFTTIIPESSGCSTGLETTLYGLDTVTGGATTYNVLDANGDGVIDASDSAGGTVVSGIAIDGGATTVFGGYAYGSGGSSVAVSGGSTASRRATWTDIRTRSSS